MFLPSRILYYAIYIQNRWNWASGVSINYKQNRLIRILEWWIWLFQTSDRCARKSKFLTFRFCRIYFRFRKMSGRKTGKIVPRNVKNRPIFRFLSSWFAKGTLSGCERNPFRVWKGPFRKPSRALFGAIFIVFQDFLRPSKIWISRIRLTHNNFWKCRKFGVFRPGNRLGRKYRKNETNF